MAKFAMLAGLFAMASLQVVRADFYIWSFQDPDPGNTYATSANEFQSCDALRNENSGQTQFAWADSTNAFGVYTEVPITQSAQSFHVKSGMCGAIQLDAYYDPNNDLWNVYNQGGGTDNVQAQCFKATGGIFSCPNFLDSFNAVEVLYCNSYLCN